MWKKSGLILLRGLALVSLFASLIFEIGHPMFPDVWKVFLSSLPTFPAPPSSFSDPACIRLLPPPPLPTDVPCSAHVVPRSTPALVNFNPPPPPRRFPPLIPRPNFPAPLPFFQDPPCIRSLDPHLSSTKTQFASEGEVITKFPLSRD